MKKPSRREFIVKSVALTGFIPLAQGFPSVSRLGAAGVEAGSRSEEASPYSSLSRHEAAFTEAMVKTLCPADHLTLDGAACGLASAVDRELAGDFGKRPSPESTLTCEQFYRMGIAALDRACEKKYGVRFDQLDAPRAATFLRASRAGCGSFADLPPASWSDPFVERLLERASFSAPIYNRYNNKVFWKLFA